jgi:group I intron endonuclease
MFYLVYKITNTLNGKYYIGCHKTKDKNDGYMGSGKLIKRAIQKYGVDHFKKEILVECSTAEEMYEQENKLVNIEEDSYNIKLGGLGGFDHINSDEQLRTSKNKKARQVTNNSHQQKLSEWGRKGGTNNFVKNGINANFKESGKTSFLGKTHSPEAKQKIAEQNSKIQKGSGNSQYGTMWITNGSCNKKISKLDSIPDGWYKGRVMRDAGKVFMDAR